MKSLGKDDLLWVGNADGTSVAVVKGQKDLKIGRSRNKISLSDKTTSGYALSAYGLSDLTLTLTVEPDLPDADGFVRLANACNVQPATPVKIQLHRKGLAGQVADALFEASMYGTITDQSSPEEGARSVSFEFGLAAVPTIDKFDL